MQHHFRRRISELPANRQERVAQTWDLRHISGCLSRKVNGDRFRSRDMNRRVPCTVKLAQLVRGGMPVTRAEWACYANVPLPAWDTTKLALKLLSRL
jgi:hypothetical protein